MPWVRPMPLCLMSAVGGGADGKAGEQVVDQDGAGADAAGYGRGVRGAVPRRWRQSPKSLCIGEVRWLPRRCRTAGRGRTGPKVSSRIRLMAGSSAGDEGGRVEIGAELRERLAAGVDGGSQGAGFVDLAGDDLQLLLGDERAEVGVRERAVANLELGDFFAAEGDEAGIDGCGAT